MRKLQKTPPPLCVKWGNAVAWLLETTGDLEVMKPAVSCLLRIHGKDFETAFTHRNAIRLARFQWKYTRHQLDAVPASDCRNENQDLDVGQLTPTMVMCEAVILHAYVSIIFHPRDQVECVRSVLMHKGVLSASEDDELFGGDLEGDLKLS